MWSLKFSIKINESFLFGKYTLKHKVDVIAYPNSYGFGSANNIQITGSAIIIGEETNINNFIEDISKDDRVVHLEYENNFAVFSINEEPKVKQIFNPDFIFEKPPVFSSKGYYFFELVSFNKSKLTNLIIQLKDKEFDIKVSKIIKSKLNHIQTAYVFPKLTEKQKRCFQSALNKGYYNVPRSITLEELAKINNLSYSTYQFHLRNAEKKIMPSFNQYL